MIDTNKMLYGSMLSGFSNNDDKPFSASYAGGILAAGHFAGPIRASTAMDNADDISQIQVRLTNVETFYRLLQGTFQVDYPTSGTRTYSVELFSYFSGGTLFVDCYIINQSGGSVTIPAITFDCLASLFLTPF